MKNPRITRWRWLLALLLGVGTWWGVGCWLSPKEYLHLTFPIYPEPAPSTIKNVEPQIEVLGERNFAFGSGSAIGQENTIPGPESDCLISRTSGYILTESPDFITAIRLPTLQTTVVRPAGPQNPNDMPTLHAISGPDTEGRIAYVEDHFFVKDDKQRRHLLKTIRISGGQDTELFSRPGDAMWPTSPAGKGEIGSHLALSARQGWIAFLSELVPVQMPSVYLHDGSVEVWSVDMRTGSKIGVKALDEGLAWFPDGKRLAYVKLVEPQTVVGQNRDADSFCKTFRGWNKVPAVFIWDVDAGTESLHQLGWCPIVSFDGRSILMSDMEGTWKQVEVATGKSSTVTCRGIAGAGVFVNPASDLVLSWCLPTKICDNEVRIDTAWCGK